MKATRLLIGFILALGAAGLAGAPASASQPSPSADEVLRELVKRSQGQPAAKTQGYYLCTKQTVTEEFDSAGHVTRRKVKVGESHIDPVAVKDANKWGNQNGVNLNEDLLRRYRFTLGQRETLNGRSTFVLTFVPKDPPPPVRHFQDRLLNQAMGTLWIDEQDYELVKANLFLAEPVGFGILGAVDVLNFSFERIHAEDGSWLMKEIDTFFKGRKFVIPVQLRKHVDCTGFKKLDTQPGAIPLEIDESSSPE
jgi:hypothetical protein